jgi:hypothetical protein
MADKTIAELDAAASAVGTDMHEIETAGNASKRQTNAQILAYIESNITALGTIATGVWQGTAVAPGFGGTGLASYAVGDLLYASGTTTLAKLADVATGNVLISGGVTTAPAWGKVDLTAHQTGILPSANGGTGVNNAGTLTNATNTTITGGGTLALGGFTLTVPATGSAALLGTANVFSAAQAVTLEDAATNTATTLATLGHNSSGTPAASFGGRILYQLESTTTADQDAAAIDAIWTTATHASRASAISLKAVTAAGALTEGIRVGTTGITLIGGITNSALLAGSLSLVANGGIALVTNNTSNASSSLRLQSGFTIASGQAVTVAFSGIITATFDVASAAASSTAVVDNLILRRNPTSGTPAAGTGQQLRMTGKSDTTADRDQLVMSAEYVVATDASRTNRGKLLVYDTAAREAMRVEASGSAPMIGFLGANAVARQTVSAAASDPATTQTLVNDIRTALINLGLAA